MGLLFLNVSIYVILLICVFGIIFLFDMRFFKTLNDLKNFWSFFFISIIIVLNLLSMAGIPPMLGFVGKFLMFLFFILKQNFFLAFLFSLTNFFIMYFYIQNIRFLISRSSSIFFLVKNSCVFFDFSIVYFLILVNFVNFFGIFFFNDFVLFFTTVSNYLFLE